MLKTQLMLNANSLKPQNVHSVSGNEESSHTHKITEFFLIFTLLFLPFTLFFVYTNQSFFYKHDLTWATFFLDTVNNYKGQNIFLKLIVGSSFLLLPSLAITVSELYRARKIKGRIKTLSISKLVAKNDYKFVDIWYFTFLTLIGRLPSLAIFITLSANLISNNLESYLTSLFDFSFILNLPIWFGASIFLVALVVIDFMDYLKHFLSHKLPVIWDSHEAHHAAKNMTIWNAKRGVLLGASILEPLFLPFYFFCGTYIAVFLRHGNWLPLAMWITYKVYTKMNDDLCHTNMLILYPYPFNLIFFSPSLHWLHHSTNPRHFDSNFSTSTPIWDKLFGTYLGEKHLQDVHSFGVINSDYNKHHPMYSFFLLPIRKLIARFKMVRDKKSLEPLYKFI